MKRFLLLILTTLIVNVSDILSQQQFEFCNNFLHNLSFISGQNEGIEQNLDDNFSWMQNQGYTHLRFFGIYPNGYHIFPSPTLDANGYPSDPTMETYLETIINKANEHGIIVNFDGLEIIAESNRDTLETGYGYITEEEVKNVVLEILSTGAHYISEEQFNGSYIKAIQDATNQVGAIHETTASLWWEDTSYADEQLASVFSFYHYNQAEVDTIFARGSFPPANLGNLHVIAEGAKYYDIPFSIAVGSFGTLETENWKNVFLFSQIQHKPERFSIEDENTSFTIWDSDFNFLIDVGNNITSYSGNAFKDRPIVNLVLDMSSLFSGTFYPTFYASEVSIPAIVNTFTALGYRVVPTTNSVIPEANIYFVILAGGTDVTNVAPLPDYVDSLLNSSSTVFLQPSYGIPDDNDASEWTFLRNYFGLPSGETLTLLNELPQEVSYGNHIVSWAGAGLWTPPVIEFLPSSQINTASASVLLSGKVNNEDIALILKNENKYLINSNVIHFETAYILSDILDGPINSPSVADIAVVSDKALIFAEYNTEVNIDLPWNGTSHKTKYDSQGSIIINTIQNTNGMFVENLERGELVILSDSASVFINEINTNTIKFNIYPNPFKSKSIISYNLPTNLRVNLSVLDLKGNEILTIVNTWQKAGEKNYELNAKDLKDGMYLVKLIAGNTCLHKKIIVAKN